MNTTGRAPPKDVAGRSKTNWADSPAKRRKQPRQCVRNHGLEGMAPTLSGQELLDRIAEFSPGMQKSRELAALRTVAAQRLKTDIGQPYMNIMQGDATGRSLP